MSDATTAGAPAPTIDPSTGAPPPPAPLSATGTPTEPTANGADTTVQPTSVPTPTDKREATLAATAMPQGAMATEEAAEAKTPDQAAEAAADPAQMPTGVLSEPNADWQIAAEGPPEEGYTKFTVSAGVDEEGKPVREEWNHKEGENPIYDKFLEDVKVRGLSQAQAQTELDRIADYVELAKLREQAKTIEQAKDWNKELQNWGFANNPQIRRNTAAALNRYDPKGRVRDLLARSGADNLPEVAHMLSDLGSHVTQGPPVTGASAPQQMVMTQNAGPKPIKGTMPSRDWSDSVDVATKFAVGAK